MRMMRTLLIACGLMVPAVAAAQPTTTPAQPATTVSAASLSLARELTTLMDLAGNASVGVDVMLDAMQAQNPELAQFRAVLQRWARTIFSTEEAAVAFARIYAEAFTEAELRDLVTFMRTPSGRRFAAAQGELARRGSEVGKRLAEENQGELMQMLQAEQQKAPPRKQN
ncbi:DUF2059 domain-containing protein [Longimicrobium sp.]|uniref:DUF2059 domain-containing protein n=1 Tax=Longimicrobium sp. TaxID=2029185 RepID=UPI002ED84309